MSVSSYFRVLLGPVPSPDKFNYYSLSHLKMPKDWSTSRKMCHHLSCFNTFENTEEDLEAVLLWSKTFSQPGTYSCSGLEADMRFTCRAECELRRWPCSPRCRQHSCQSQIPSPGHPSWWCELVTYWWPFLLHRRDGAVDQREPCDTEFTHCELVDDRISTSMTDLVGFWIRKYWRSEQDWGMSPDCSWRQTLGGFSAN